MTLHWCVPGARCVLIVDPSKLYDLEAVPEPPTIKRGEVLTVAAVLDHSIGIIIRFNGHPINGWYTAKAFRPVVDRSEEQDLAIFRTIADHIDPIVRAEEYERSLDEIEAALNNFDLP